MMGGECSILFCGLADLIALIFLSSPLLFTSFITNAPIKPKTSVKFCHPTV